VSNYRAIGAVSATMRHLLEQAVRPIQFGSQSIAVDVRSPSQRADNDRGPAIYLFLYQTGVNSHWRNVDLPTRSSDGRLLQRPAIGLDLSYLLTFYGTGLEPEILMGRTISALHARPLLSQAQIAEALDAAGTTPSGINLLRTTDLGQVERIRFSPIPLNLEELSKLWMTLIHKPYALSIAYQVSVLIVEAEDMMPARALPVRGHGFGGGAGGIPQIEQVVPQFVEPGAQVTLRGKNLVAERFTVQIGETVLSFSPANPPARSGEGDVQIALPANLPAGIHRVRVVQQVPTREQPAAAKGGESRQGSSQVASNAAVLVLRPVLTIPPTAPAPGTVEFEIAPPLLPGQRGLLLLNEWKADPGDDSPRAAYSVELPAVEQPAGRLSVPLPDVAPGSYLARVQVDGAESSLALTQEPGEAEPRFGQPRVTVS
jgi:hypothetical protein